MVIHWDTKLLTTMTGENEDRLAIIATAAGQEQILDMLEIPNGTGRKIFSAVTILCYMQIYWKILKLLYLIQLHPTQADSMGFVRYWRMPLEEMYYFSDVDITFLK